MFTSGVLPVGVHAAENTCITNGKANQLRRWADKLRRGYTRASATAASVLLGDPVVNIISGTAKRWAREVWLSDHDPAARFRLSDIRRFFWAVKGKGWPKSWRQYRGPLHAVALELERLGWP